MKCIAHTVSLLALMLVATSLPARAEPLFSDGFENGVLCAWSAQFPPVDEVEICDSIDNDCNGMVDDDCVHCRPDQPFDLCGVGHHCTAEENGDTVCRAPIGSGTQGDNCGSQTDCAEAHLCAFDGVAFSCAQWCEVGGFTCPLGSCVSLSPPRFVGASEWGVCQSF